MFEYFSNKRRRHARNAHVTRSNRNGNVSTPKCGTPRYDLSKRCPRILMLPLNQPMGFPNISPYPPPLQAAGAPRQNQDSRPCECSHKMTSSTLTLPVNALSVLPNASRTSLSKAPSTGIERSASPSRRHPHDQEAIEMNVLGEKPVDSTSMSSMAAPEIPAWTMTTNPAGAVNYVELTILQAGWNDATTGPLLPTIQAHYGYEDMTNAGAVLQVVAYCLLAPALPFPVMCIAYAVNGFGIALQDAQANGFVAELPNNASAKMGLLHAVYGAGAFIAPLVATQFAQLQRWSFHYLTSLGVSLANAIVLLVVFKLRRQHDIMGLPDPNTAHAHTEVAQASGSSNKYKQIFSSRAVQLMAFFVWVYVGVEVTIGGNSLSKNVVVDLPLGTYPVVSSAIGERRVVYIYCLLCIALELVIWLVPNIIGNALAVSIVGMLLGEWNCLLIARLSDNSLQEYLGWLTDGKKEFSPEVLAG
ncbi:MFS_1 domain-containing protein [Rhizoctonia solani AG-1 IA]|uniref:MFS_1 domain-containing protein n=1 Tax=Thanatephorus cucumeris (strain AG1-IA) TaxID=983506 RepID=L8WU21_THACA|nr:MFS_1 domain-containing protein [Rhizoctonia solani AG-1 IA]